MVKLSINESSASIEAEGGGALLLAECTLAFVKLSNVAAQILDMTPEQAAIFISQHGMLGINAVRQNDDED